MRQSAVVISRDTALSERQGNKEPNQGEAQVCLPEWERSSVTDREPSSARSGQERNTMIDLLTHSNALRAEGGSPSEGGVELCDQTDSGDFRFAFRAASRLSSGDEDCFSILGRIGYFRHIVVDQGTV
jgi:hypothetical protein